MLPEPVVVVLAVEPEVEGVEGQGMRMPDLERLPPVVVRIVTEGVDRYMLVRGHSNIWAMFDSTVHTTDTSKACNTAGNEVYKMAPNVRGDVRNEFPGLVRVPEKEHNRVCYRCCARHSLQAHHCVHNLCQTLKLSLKK